MDRYYKYFRWLSLDIVLGAIFFLAYLGKIYQIALQIPTYIALGSAIWLIYTSDHLFDAYKTNQPSTQRHTFHKRYFNQLTMTSGLVMIIALINLWFLDVQIIRNGAILSAISVAYLMLVFFVKRLWVKELLVAMVYAIGIFLAPLTKVGIDSMSVFYTIQLAGIAFLNLLIFSKMDMQSDAQDGFNSLALKLGSKSTVLLIQILSAILLSTCLFGIFNYSADIQLLYAMMTIILLIVHQNAGFFSENERFRTIGDGVFYLPLLFILF